jgi:hypothetical protein
MSHPILQQVTGEVPRETFQLVDPDTGDPVDLTGLASSTIFIYIRKQGAVGNKWTDSETEITSILSPPTDGKVTYDFPGELEAGLWQGEIEIPVGVSQSRFSERFDIIVRPGFKP